MQQRMIEGSAPKERSLWQRMPLALWLMIAFFMCWPTFLMIYTHPPKPRASLPMRARLQPVLQALEQRESDARADHPQTVSDDGPGGWLGLDAIGAGLGRHPSKGDKGAVDAVLDYRDWVTDIEKDHGPASRGQLDDTDRKLEVKTHKELTEDVVTRLSPRPAYAPPQWFYDHPQLLVLPFLLVPAIMISAFGPTARDALQRRRLKRIGVPIMGTILSAQSTGVSINRVPQLLIQARLETGEEVEYRKLSMYSFGIAAGTQVQLLVDPKDHTKVTEA